MDVVEQKKQKERKERKKNQQLAAKEPNFKTKERRSIMWKIFQIQFSVIFYFPMFVSTEDSN